MEREPTTTPEVTRTYRVDVGHSTILVESTSIEGAIRAARTKLSLEMPRLWDVIQRMTPDKFNVSMVY